MLEHVIIHYISLDHDLAEYDDTGEEVTGYTVICKIEEIAFDRGYCPFDINVHSANPVGIKRMNSVINNIHRRFPTKL